MASWDRRTPAQQSSARDTALRTQVVDAVGPFSPWWRDRFSALGRTPASVATVDGLAGLPAAGERDLCPDGDPKGAAALVLQAGERGYALHASGPALRRALLQRLVAPGRYRATVEADTRPTSFVTDGLAVRFPVASTRGDLDVLARAGARLWQVLGLTGADVLVAGLPTAPSPALQALQLAALGAGAPAAFPGDDPDVLVETLRLLPATVLALPTDSAVTVLEELAAAGAPLETLALLLLVGAPTDAERSAAQDAVREAGAARAQVLAVHAASGHRLLWAECRQSAGRPVGLHTSPDLELVQLVDPETGLAARGGGAGETAVTQLGLRGSALLRWRTGDVADAVQEGACPACGRTVPRVVGLRRRALVPVLTLREGRRAVDLRTVAAALAGRPDVDDFRVVLTRSRRSGADQVLVHVVVPASTDPSDAVVAVAADVRRACGLLPSQVVLGLPTSGTPLSRRLLVQGDLARP